jgi:hypothetical protein
MEIPVFKVETLYHIGTLDPSMRGHNYADSQEGHLLSVSNCPLEWRQIAKLGGYPLHTVESDNEILLLDVLRAVADPVLSESIEAWGVEQGLCERKELWLSWETDEEGEWRPSTYLTRDEAERENQADEIGEERPDGLPLIEPREFAVGTAKLASLVCKPSIGSSAHALEFVAILWAEENFPNLHGVWWEDVIDVYSHRAPRGGIFPERLPKLNFAEVPFGHATEDPEPLETGVVGSKKSLRP